MNGLPLAAGLLVSLTPWLLAQAGDLQAKINRALDEARPALLAHLEAATGAGVRPGQLALLLLAAVHDGVSATEPAMQKAIAKLAAADPDETYDLSLRLIVMEALVEFPDRVVRARRDAKELLSHRDDSGAFSYARNPVDWDLSNTQYAALGLRAAKSLGVTIERSVWSKLAKTVGEQQDNYGGFTYRERLGTRARPERQDPPDPGGPGGFPSDSYASMTAAGIAVLAICRQALGEDDQKNSASAKLLTRGWQWFDRNVGAIGSPTERWSYYFHYGLERAAILCDVEKVGGKDWYALGAEMLLRDQLPGGGWDSATDGGGGDGRGGGGRHRGRGQPVATAFAVLFLRRKFLKVPVPITPHVITLAAIGPKSKPEDVAACAAELVRRGKEAVPEVLRALRSEIVPQRQAAAAALAQLAGETFGFDPALDADGNRDALKKAELWHLRAR
jgi:hypothetical protein